MAITNPGIYMFGQVVQGNTVRFPNYISYSEDTYIFDPNITQTGSEVIRVPITWSTTGLYAKYEGVITSAEAIGSTIYSEYLVDDATIGSDNIWFTNESIVQE